MFARRALLWTFAGGCLSGALFILSGVGLVSIWRDTGTWQSARTFARNAPQPAVTANSIQERPAARDNVVPLAVEPPRAPASPRPVEERASTGDEPSDQKDNQEVDSGTSTESGSSVADVLVRLETAYRQGLAPTTFAVASRTATPMPAPVASNSPAPAATVATAPTAAPANTAPSEPAPPLPARQEPSVTVSVIIQNPPAPAPVAAPPVAAPVEVPPVAAAQPAVAAQNDTLPSGDFAGASPTNIHIDNLHQGDVYQVQQQLMLQQYLQVLGGSPYGGYPAYAPTTLPARNQSHGANSSSFSNLPTLPVAAPPFPPFLVSVTNPDNPFGVHTRAIRMSR